MAVHLKKIRFSAASVEGILLFCRRVLDVMALGKQAYSIDRWCTKVKAQCQIRYACTKTFEHRNAARTPARSFPG